MNIFDMFKELEKDNYKIFTDGWNTIRYGPDSYEFTIVDKDNHSVTVIASNWKEVDK
jgi:hypothetical protein